MKEMASQERVEARQEKMNAQMEARAEVRQERADARQEKANADMKASQERANAEMKASQERASAEMKAVQAEIKAKKRIQDSVGSRQKLSASRKRVIRRAVPAVRKGKIRKCPSNDNVPRGASRKKTLEKRQRNNCECKNHRRNRDFKKRLCLRMNTTSERITRKRRELSLFGLLFAIREVNKNAFWKVRPPPKRKKDVLTA
jgi:hypothetical protein